MTGFEKSKAFVKEFQELLNKYSLELTGYVEPCDEGNYAVWLKEKDNEETAYSFLFGDWGEVEMEDYTARDDGKFYERSLEDEY